MYPDTTIQSKSTMYNSESLRTAEEVTTSKASLQMHKSEGTWKRGTITQCPTHRSQNELYFENHQKKASSHCTGAKRLNRGADFSFQEFLNFHPTEGHLAVSTYTGLSMGPVQKGNVWQVLRLPNEDCICGACRSFPNPESSPCAWGHP